MGKTYGTSRTRQYVVAIANIVMPCCCRVVFRKMELRTANADHAADASMIPVECPYCGQTVLLYKKKVRGR